MKEAISIAKHAIELGYKPYGACIIRKEHIISKKINSTKINTDVTAHAEIEAIRQACLTLKTLDLSDCQIYTTCEPCLMCIGASVWAKIPIIYFGVSSNDVFSLGFNQLTVRIKSKKIPVKIVGGVLRSESYALFSQWKKLYSDLE